MSTKPVELGGRGSKESTGTVDLTRDKDGNVRARLLDLAPGRSGEAYKTWLKARGDTFRKGVAVSTLDPLHGYKNAIDDQLEDAVAVLNAFHVVKLGTAAVDEVRRRVQQEIHGHRGRKTNPLYRCWPRSRRARFRTSLTSAGPWTSGATRSWATSTTDGANNGGTKAINAPDRTGPPGRPRVPQPRQLPTLNAPDRRRSTHLTPRSRPEKP